MNIHAILLLVTVVAFATLVWFVYAPSRRQRLERLGSMPLDDDDLPPSNEEVRQ